MPVVMLFLFGYGVSTDLDHIPLAFADQDQSEASRALARAFDGSRRVPGGGAAHAGAGGVALPRAAPRWPRW